MSHQQPTPDKPNLSPRLPFYTKAASFISSETGKLARSVSSSAKALLDGSSLSGNSMGMGQQSGGVFAGYKNNNPTLYNLPLSRFRNTTDFMGAYGNIADVYTCVNTVANAIAGLPTDFTDAAGKTIATLGQAPSKPGTLAFLLENPNPYQSWGELRETISAHMDLVGNSILLQDNMDGQGRPEFLYPLNPSFIKLIVDSRDGLLGYLYQTGDLSSRIIYDPDEIIHMKSTNPRSIMWGQGRLEALAAQLDIELDMTDALRALYKNGAVIPGAFVQKEIMSDAQYKRLKNELMQEHTGVSNFYRPLLLDGGMDWKQMTVGHAELGTFDLKLFNREQIYMAFNVPYSQAGNEGKSNVKNDHLTDIFWTTSIRPRTYRIETGFQPLCRKFDERLSIKLPLPIKVAEAEMLNNAILADTLTSLAVSEKRIIIRALLGTQFGLDNMPDEMPEPPKPKLPPTLPGAPAASAAPGTDPNAPALPPGAPGAPPAIPGSPKNPLTQLAQPNPLVGFGNGKSAGADEGATAPMDKNGAALSEEQKDAVWLDFDQKAASLEKEFAAQLKGFLEKALEELTGEFHVLSFGLPELFAKFRKVFEDLAEPHIEKALETGHRDITGSRVPHAEIKAIAKKRAEQLAEQLTEDTFKAVQGQVAEAEAEAMNEVVAEAEAGDFRPKPTEKPASTSTETPKPVEKPVPAPQLKKIEGLFSQGRANLIAATETTGAMNTGRNLGLIEKGVKQKMWLSKRDSKVRPDHREADGQKSDVIDGMFEVGGSKLRYPGDPLGPAREICNCRCVLVEAPAD